jgi:hypothetical protein
VGKVTLSIIISQNIHRIMRSRWAAAAVDASVAKNKAQAAAAQQQAAAAQQQPNTALQPQQTGQEDVTQRLEKLANLKQQGFISG